MEMTPVKEITSPTRLMPNSLEELGLKVQVVKSRKLNTIKMASQSARRNRKTIMILMILSVSMGTAVHLSIPMILTTSVTLQSHHTLHITERRTTQVTFRKTGGITSTKTNRHRRVSLLTECFQTTC